jgi:hypothetical protein
MAIQVGKFTKAFSLNTAAGVIMSSDTVNIPFSGSAYKSGTTNAGVVTNKLADSTANFLSTGANALNVQVGDIVWNLNNTVPADQKTAIVTAIDSATVLSISQNIFTTSSIGYRIFSANEFMNGPTIPCYLIPGSGGTVRVLTASGEDVTFYSVTANVVLPIQVVRLYKTSTSITAAVALW